MFDKLMTIHSDIDAKVNDQPRPLVLIYCIWLISLNISSNYDVFGFNSSQRYVSKLFTLQKL